MMMMVTRSQNNPRAQQIWTHILKLLPSVTAQSQGQQETEKMHFLQPTTEIVSVWRAMCIACMKCKCAFMHYVCIHTCNMRVYMCVYAWGLWLADSCLLWGCRKEWAWVAAGWIKYDEPAVAFHCCSDVMQKTSLKQRKKARGNTRKGIGLYCFSERIFWCQSCSAGNLFSSRPSSHGLFPTLWIWCAWVLNFCLCYLRQRKPLSELCGLSQVIGQDNTVGFHTLSGTHKINNTSDDKAVDS